MRSLFGSALVAVLLTTVPCAAQDRDLATCRDGRAAPARVVEACGKVLAREPAPGDELAAAARICRWQAWSKLDADTRPTEPEGDARQAIQLLGYGSKGIVAAATCVPAGDIAKAVCGLEPSYGGNAHIIDACTLVVGRSPSDAAERLDALERRFRALVKESGRSQEARSDVSSLLAALPNRADLYFERARLSTTVGSYRVAVRDLDRALQLRPDDVEYLMQRGMLRFMLGDFDRVEADLETLIRVDPRSGEIWSARATYWAMRGDTDKAAEDFRKAKLFWTGKGLPLPRELDRATLLRMAVEYYNILTPSGRSQESDPLVRSKAAALVRAGDLDAARAAFDDAVRLNPQDAAALAGRAELRRGRGDRTGAEADNRAAVAVDEASIREQGRDALVAQDAARLALGLPPPAAPREPGPAAASIDLGTRVALVVGNGSYATVPKLRNAGRDAESVATALRALGFKTVQVGLDLGREGMVQALRRFAAEAERADWSLVYYAGHGIEVGGTNYLIPIDARLASDKDVPDEAVSLERVLSALEGTRKIRVVILDACRDNPFIPAMRRTGASRSIGRGLAAYEPEAGVLVAYAAKQGQVAADGDDGNSPFVAALVRRLAMPGLEINLLFRTVRDDVLARTARRQEPYIYSSLPGEAFYFRPP